MQEDVPFDFGIADFGTLGCATVAESPLVQERPHLPLVVLSSWREWEAKAQVTEYKSPSELSMA